jgi:hypothetical protein
MNLIFVSLGQSLRQIGETNILDTREIETISVYIAQPLLTYMTVMCRH